VAKKVRTPPPPRRVQAPKRRDVQRSSDDRGRRQRLMLFGIAGSGILMLVLVIAFFALAGGGPDVAKAMSQAGCTFESPPNQGRQHTAKLNDPAKHNSFPFTSGVHYFQPAIFGIYERPLNQLQVLHNLEHGGIAIQYGSRVPRATVTQIGQFYRDDANAMIVAPLPRLGDKVALTAWTHIATCTSFDQDAFKTFRDAYRYKGPESFPKDALQPGQ
jgi:hypothetical protein